MKLGQGVSAASRLWFTKKQQHGIGNRENDYQFAPQLIPR
jgi:hypothetical protein